MGLTTSVSRRSTDPTDPTDEDAAADDGDAPAALVVIAPIALVALGLGVAVLLVFEGTDAVRTLRRRASHHMADWWAGIERRERRLARRGAFGDVAALAVRTTRH